MTSEGNKAVLEFIERVAEVSENTGFHAGVGRASPFVLVSKS